MNLACLMPELAKEIFLLEKSKNGIFERDISLLFWVIDEVCDDDVGFG